MGQFHMREGKIVDKRDFFWEDLPELIFEAGSDAEEGSPEPSPSVSLSEHAAPPSDVRQPRAE